MTDVRPEPWSESPPDGYEWAPSVDVDWMLGTYTGEVRRCRGGGFGANRCPNDAVASLKRSDGKYWAYCVEHMYSRWIENGQVWVWALREVPSCHG